MKKDIYGHPWEEIAIGWKNVKSPNIPNKEERGFYDEYIKLAKKKNPNAKALVLGATVEIRDLLYKNKISAVVCDLNIDMILALTKLCRYKNIQDNEIWMKCDWINMPLSKNYFDIILGDGAINQLPVNLYSDFLKNIKELLKPDGYFVQRTGVVRKEYFKDDYEIMDYYLSQKNPDPDLVFETLTLFSSALDKKTMKTSVKGIYEIMDLHLENVKGEKRKKLKKIIKKMESSYPRNEKTWTMPLLEDMKKYYSKHFDQFEVRSGKNYGKLIPAYPFFIAKNINK